MISKGDEIIIQEDVWCVFVYTHMSLYDSRGAYRSTGSRVHSLCHSLKPPREVRESYRVEAKRL